MQIGPYSLVRKTLDSNDQNQRFSLKQWFTGGAQSRGLRKPGCGHCYLRFFPRSRLNILLNFTFESEAIRANLHGNEKILRMAAILE